MARPPDPPPDPPPSHNESEKKNKEKKNNETKTTESGEKSVDTHAQARTKTREIRRPSRFALSSHIPTPDTPVPRPLREAQKSAFWEGFQGAINAEIKALEEKGTWEYVERKEIPEGSNILRAKFVFDIKRGPQREFLKYKARLVAMGYTQIEGVDFF